MEKIKLTAKKRKLIGRQAKKLRGQGLLPSNIYGNKIKSQTVEVLIKDFNLIYKKAGETRLVDLDLGEKDIRPVLIHNVQIDPISRYPIHVDFYQVDLKQKVKTNVPVILTGKSPAVEQKAGLLLQLINEVEVEALPTDLPEKMSLDVSSLVKVDQELKVSDLKVLKNVSILTDLKLGIVKVGRLVSKEAEALVKEEAAASAAAKASSAESVQAATAPATGDKPQETVPTTDKSIPSSPTTK